MAILSGYVDKRKIMFITDAITCFELDGMFKGYTIVQKNSFVVFPEEGDFVEFRYGENWTWSAIRSEYDFSMQRYVEAESIRVSRKDIEDYLLEKL